MISTSRILLLITFSLFWGGLTFYTGFVVRISHDILIDPMVGGLITQRVTQWLQFAGVLTVVFMLWNTVLVGKVSRKYGFTLALCSLILICSLAGLMLVHAQLDAVIDANALEITNRDAFTIGHRRYNQLTTIEWISSLSYLIITTVAWRRIDRQPTVQENRKDT